MSIDPASSRASARETIPDATRKAGVRIPELDGLRGVAILLILIWHYVYSGLPPSLKTWMLRSSWSGVDLFFVLSGFLIGGILIDARQSSNLFKTFYSRRVFRIVPLYWLVLGAYAVLSLPRLRETAAAASLVEPRLSGYLYVVFLQNFAMAWSDTLGAPFLAATWSLAIEEQFYLTLPFVVRAVPTRALAWVCVGSVAFANLLRVVVCLLTDRVWPAYVLMPCRMDALMLGVLAAIIVRSENARMIITRRSNVLWAVAFSLFLLIGYMTRKNWMIASTEMATWGYTVLALFYSLVLLLSVTQNRSALSRGLRFTPLRRLGGIAYGVYLFHLPVNGFLHAYIRNTGAQLLDVTDVGITAIALGLTLTLATVSWRLFERPLIGIAHRLSY